MSLFLIESCCPQQAFVGILTRSVIVLMNFFVKVVHFEVFVLHFLTLTLCVQIV
jgi:hypothetical protein